MDDSSCIGHKSVVATSLDEGTWEKVNDVTLWIAKQRDVFSLQRGTLERVAALIPHRSSMFDLAVVRQDETVTYTHAISTTMSKDTLSSYYLRYAALDYTTWSFNPHEVEVYRDLDLVDVAKRDETPIYREWMRPQGVYYGAAPPSHWMAYRLEVSHFFANERRVTFLQCRCGHFLNLLAI